MTVTKTAFNIGAKQIVKCLIIELGILAVQDWVKALLNGQVSCPNFVFGADDTFTISQLFVSKEAGTTVVHFQDHLIADETFVREEEQ